jgi:hypothetical protein
MMQVCPIRNIISLQPVLGISEILDPDPRIHTSDKRIRIRIREVQKHTVPTDPDADAEPNHQHCLQSFVIPVHVQ